MFREVLGRLKGSISLYNILKPEGPDFEISDNQKKEPGPIRAFVVEPEDVATGKGRFVPDILATT
jgi:hypothetical protein